MANDMAVEASFFEPAELEPLLFDAWGGDFPEFNDGSDDWRRRRLANLAATTAVPAYGCRKSPLGSRFSFQSE